MQRFASTILACCFAGSLIAETSLRAPPEFIVEKAAGGPEVRFPMFAAFDDRGRLFVAESSGLDLYAELSALTRKCRVCMLEDRDGDGRFERSTIFADRLVFPMGLAWRDGRLYVADPPDLVALEDNDGDGHAEKRTLILTGFGHRDNGSLHGLTFGPDGRLYMTIGEPDGYRLKRSDGSTLEGNSGALIRCRPDGSDPEIVCRGFVNLVEVIFTPSGEIVGTDNWFQRPSGGVRDALVHLVEGGLYPYIADNGSPKPVTGEPLPPLAMFPAAALSGLEIYRGRTFSKTMQGSIFSAQHNTRKIVRHVLKREGATFRAESFDFLTTDDPDFHPSDVLEDADGSLLVLDTGSWYVQHCPTGRIRKSAATGGIYRVRAEHAVPPKDPWGLGENWNDAPTRHLLELLDDERPVVRDRAQRVLAARGHAATAALTEFVTTSGGRLGRQTALWSLAGKKDPASIDAARVLLRDRDPDVVATAARVVALQHATAAKKELHSLLSDSHLQVRLAAAGALAQCGAADSVPHLWQALEDASDRFLEHALIYAAHHLADEGALQGALDHRNPRVQRAALQLLAGSPRPASALTSQAVVARVGADDARLRQTALALLRSRSEWASQGVELVRGWVERALAGNPIERTTFRDVILAFQNNAEMQATVGAALKQTNAILRELTLETVNQCTLDGPPSTWKDGLAACIADGDPTIRLLAIRAAIALRLHALDGRIVERAEDPNETVVVRLEAARVAARQTKLSPAVFDFLLSQLAAANEPVSKLVAAERLGQCALSDVEVCSALKAVRGQQLISPSRLLSSFKQCTSDGAAIALVDAVAEAVRDGWRPAESELQEFVERLPATARERAGTLSQRAHLDVEAQRARLAQFTPLLAGGEPEAGRAVFFGTRSACYVCHTVGTEGGKLGPDLTKIGAIRAGPDIVESIVLPSATFAQGYQSFVVAAEDGTELSGIVIEQNGDAVVLRDSGNVEHRFRRGQIKELRALPVSFMPEGLATALTEQEFRDLLAFLQQLK